ncbi:MAG: ATP-binding protein [Fuerstiella sp.]
MKFLTAKTQMTLGLICMQVSILCAAMWIGLVPDRLGAVMSGRADLCESIAIVSSRLMSQQQDGELAQILQEMAERNDSILSAGIRTSDNRLLQEIGDHAEFWKTSGTRSTENEILVPILAQGKRWGNVELRFAPAVKDEALGFLQHPWMLLTVFVSALSGVLFYIYLRKMLKHLDPSKAVPKRVRAALDSLAEGLLVLDRQERIVLANQAFAEWVGVNAEKLTGTDANVFRWITSPPDGDADTTGLPWTDALRKERAQAGVMIGLSHDGRPAQNLMANASPVLGYDGKYGGVLVSFDDVTQLEETRKDLKVAKEVAEDAQQMAEQANQAKSDFLARMSHEIRTPMNAILGYTEVLRNGFDDNVDERFTYLDTIHASGEHLLALINDILDLSKIESGQMELDRQRHSLRDLISQVVSVMNVKAKEKSIALKFEADGLVPETILTDAVRFRQTVFNLVGNAVKFTEEGEVRIVVGLADDGLLRVDVIDTGVGIAADAVEKVFERFTQANASVSTKFGGTGLGLSISKRLAHMMGGDVTVTSVLGQGSTFTMTIDPGPVRGIPLIDPTAEQAVATRRETAAAALQLPPCRVLIVDDEKANRGLAGIHISRAGGTFAEACDGLQAVEMATSDDFDIILMDFNMPVMGGLDATRRLRELGCTTPVVALTANVMQDDRDSAMDAGCNGFLTKPIKMADLINELNRLLPPEVAARQRSAVQRTPVSERESTPGPAAAGEAGQAGVPAESPADQRTCEPVEYAVGLPLETETGTQVGADTEIATDTEIGTECGAEVGAQTGPVTEPLSHQPSSEPDSRAQQILESVSEEFGERPAKNAELELIESSLPTDDPDFYEIVAAFMPRLRSQVPLLRQCMEQSDFEGLRQLAHWLAGSGGTVGYGVFVEPCRALQSLARAEATEGMSELIDQIESLADRVVVSKSQPAEMPARV